MSLRQILLKEKAEAGSHDYSPSLMEGQDHKNLAIVISCVCFVLTAGCILGKRTLSEKRILFEYCLFRQQLSTQLSGCVNFLAFKSICVHTPACTHQSHLKIPRSFYNKKKSTNCAVIGIFLGPRGTFLLGIRDLDEALKETGRH